MFSCGVNQIPERRHLRWSRLDKTWGIVFLQYHNSISQVYSILDDSILSAVILFLWQVYKIRRLVHLQYKYSIPLVLIYQGFQNPNVSQYDLYYSLVRRQYTLEKNIPAESNISRQNHITQYGGSIPLVRPKYIVSTEVVYFPAAESSKMAEIRQKSGEKVKNNLRR